MSAAVLTLAAFYALAARCADMPADPAAARAWTERLAAHAQVESGFRPAALNVNGGGGGPRRAASVDEAAALASRLVAAGRSVDLGLMQVNSRHLARLGLTVPELMEPCRNVAVGAAILADAERAAACIYNSGRHDCRRPSGTNGYPEKIRAAAARVAEAGRAVPTALAAASAPAAPAPRRADGCVVPEWDVFARCPRRPAAPSFPDRGIEAAAPGPVLLNGLATGPSR